MKIFIFTGMKNRCILHGCVFVMIALSRSGLLLSFSKVFINMHEYVNKIICILNYDKTEHYRLSFGTKLISLGYLAA